MIMLMGSSGVPAGGQRSLGCLSAVIPLDTDPGV